MKKKHVSVIRRFSPISLMHFWKMVFRCVLFLGYGTVYVLRRIRRESVGYSMVETHRGLMLLIWLAFVLEMILRFFPSRMESKGCQKQFRRNYVPALPEHIKPPKESTRREVLRCAGSWLGLNSIVGVLYFTGILDQGLLLLLSLAYSICDMICILFFCPFQSWMMKNKCCGTCRIYNWDYAMMFTPLAFVPNVYGWSLLGLGLALLIEWEVLYALHPERFSETTNRSLRCENCQEKLCRHKKSLAVLILHQRRRLKAVYDELKLPELPGKLPGKLPGGKGDHHGKGHSV